MTCWTKNLFVAAIAVAVLSTGIPTVANADMGIVKKRVAAMKSISKANKAVQGAAKGKVSASKAAAAANEIAMLAEQIPTWFPKGTSSKDAGMAMETRAKPDIWAKMDDFKSKAGSLKAAAQNFAKVAAAGDKAAIAAAAGEVRKSCGGCHKAFRGPKPKKKM